MNRQQGRRGKHGTVAWPRRPLLLVLLSEMKRTEGLDELLRAIGGAARVIVASPAALHTDCGAIDAIVTWNGGNPKLLFAKLGGIPCGLQWIHHSGAGVDKFLDADLIESDVTITTVQGLTTYADGIAEFVMGLILMFAKRLLVLEANRRERAWVRFEHTPLCGATVGILGLGSIGRAVARRARAFGMSVVGTRRNPGVRIPGVRVLGPDRLRDVVTASDYLVLSAAHTAETHHLINRETIAWMPTHSVLINVARGGLIEESALVEALTSERIAGAALDVFDEEPLTTASELWSTRNLFISPHLAGSVAGSKAARAEAFVANLNRFIRGDKLSQIVDVKRGY